MKGKKERNYNDKNDSMKAGIQLALDNYYKYVEFDEADYGLLLSLAEDLADALETALGE